MARDNLPASVPLNTIVPLLFHPDSTQVTAPLIPLHPNPLSMHRTVLSKRFRALHFFPRMYHHRMWRQLRISLSKRRRTTYHTCRMHISKVNSSRTLKISSSSNLRQL